MTLSSTAKFAKPRTLPFHASRHGFLGLIGTVGSDDIKEWCVKIVDNARLASANPNDLKYQKDFTGSQIELAKAIQVLTGLLKDNAKVKEALKALQEVRKALNKLAKARNLMIFLSDRLLEIPRLERLLELTPKT